MQWIIDLIKTWVTSQIEFGANMPPYTIIGWYGLIANIPPGWHQCNGDEGTPRLNGKFVRSAGDGIPFDSSGGTVFHNHDVIEGHSHDIGPGSNIAAGTDYAEVTGNPNSNWQTKSEDNIPPYHAVWWIMKLP